VAVESIAAKNEEKLVPPSSVGSGVGVEDDGDQGHDVRDPGGLKVEVGDHGVVRATRESSTWLERSRRRRLLRRGDTLPRRGVDEALRLGDPASKSVSGGTLVLPGEGGHTYMLLGGGCRGLGILRGHNEGTVGGRDGRGTWRQPTKEGGGGEGSGRRRYAVEGTVGVAAEEKGTVRAHCTNTRFWRSTHGRRRPSGGGGGDQSGDGAASTRAQAKRAGEGGGQGSRSGIQDAWARTCPQEVEGGSHGIRPGRYNNSHGGEEEAMGGSQGLEGGRSCVLGDQGGGSRA
jgi:hypothetical protein